MSKFAKVRSRLGSFIVYYCVGEPDQILVQDPGSYNLIGVTKGEVFVDEAPLIEGARYLDGPCTLRCGPAGAEFYYVCDFRPRPFKHEVINVSQGFTLEVGKILIMCSGVLTIGGVEKNSPLVLNAATRGVAITKPNFKGAIIWPRHSYFSS